MESQKELNERIIKLTGFIQNNYPELSEYLNELRITLPDQSKPEINTKILKEYYELLDNFYSEYASHKP